VHAARSRGPQVRGRAPVGHQIIRVRYVAGLAQQPERRLITRVRRCGHEDDPDDAGGEVGHHRGPIGARRQVMRFVHDEHIERGRIESGPHFRALDEIDRGDDEWRRVPGVDARGKGREGGRERHAVEDRCVQPESLAHFGGPLFAQRRRRQHQYAAREPVRQQFRDDQQRLNRLAEADVIREQEPRRAGDGGLRGLELPWPQLDARRRRRPAVEPAGGLGEEGCCVLQHSAPRRTPDRGAGGDRLHPIEGRQQPHQLADVLAPAAAQREQRDVLESFHPDDRPRLVAGFDAPPTRERTQFLHACLPTECARTAGISGSAAPDGCSRQGRCRKSNAGRRATREAGA
jgi:hypothetical protein